MKHLNKPNIFESSEYIYLNCANDFKKKKEYEPLVKKYKGSVKKAAGDYDRMIPKDIAGYVCPKVDKNDEVFFKDLYKQKFSNKESVGRKYYDRIMLNGGRNCPICELNTPPRELDHFLPKSKYPLLCVLPENLIPICYDCNHNKSSIFINDYYLIPFHPYYEEITEQWLECKISYFSDMSCETIFYNGCSKSNPLWGKYEAQFNTYGLSERYNLSGIAYVDSMRIDHELDFKAGGEKCVYDALINRKKIEEAKNVNSYESATVRAVIDGFDKYIEWLNLF